MKLFVLVVWKIQLIAYSHAVFFFIALDFTSQQTHPQLCIVSAFVSLFILSGNISLFFPSRILNTYQPEGHIFLCYVFLPSMLFMGFSRQEYCSGLPFLSTVVHIFSLISTITCSSWWSCTTCFIFSLSYTRLLSMWSFWLDFCDCVFHSGGHVVAVLTSSLMTEDKKLVQTLMGRTGYGENWVWRWLSRRTYTLLLWEHQNHN